MTEQAEHTPTPWEAVQVSGWEFAIRSGGTIANIVQKMDFPAEENGAVQGRSENRMRADAAFIVKACNSYEETHDLLEDLWERVNDYMYANSGDYFEFKERIEQQRESA